MKRKKLSKRANIRSFKHSARKVHKKNLKARARRGGYCL